MSREKAQQPTPEKEVAYLIGALILLMVVGLGMAIIFKMGAPMFDQDNMSGIGEQRLGESLSVGKCRDAAQTRADYDSCEDADK